MGAWSLMRSLEVSETSLPTTMPATLSASAGEQRK